MARVMLSSSAITDAGENAMHAMGLKPSLIARHGKRLGLNFSP
jgi:hypothetical protein